MQGAVFWTLLALLAVALAAAAVQDWRGRRIRNWLNGAIACLAIPFWWSAGLSLWPDAALQVAVAAAVVVVLMPAFMINWMGGGDVKLIGALALWLPPLGLLKLLVIMSLAGGVLTLAVVIAHRFAKRAGQPETPYGLAIVFAGFWLISERFLNQFV